MIDILRRPFRRWIAAAAACVALLAACGGGAPADTARPQAAASVQTAAASPTQLLTPYVLYNWAVTAYPALFPYCPPLSGGWLCDPDKATGPYVYRYYSKSHNYLGAAGRDIYLLGPASGGSIRYVGNIGQFACNVNASACGTSTETAAPLFMLDSANGEISVFRQPNPESGKALVGATFMLGTALGSGLAYDGTNDRLFVPAWGGQVLVLDQASTLSGNVAAARTIQPAGLSVNGFSDIFYDKANDVLYAHGSRTYDDVIAVFNHASTRSGSGAPDRLITWANHFNAFTIDATRSIGYVATDYNISAIDNFSVANGAVQVSRTFTSYPVDPELYFIPSSIAVDPARDRLYVGVVDGGVHVLSGASTASGTAHLAAFAGLDNLRKLTFDPVNDRLYLSAYRDAYVVNGASTMASGAVADSAQKLIGATGMSIAGFASATTQ